MQKTPSQLRFKFCNLYSKSEKKKSSRVWKILLFFCINELHLVRGFQKGITLGVMCPGTLSKPHPQPQPHPPPPKSWNMSQDPKCYTFLESSHQMQSIYAEKSKIFHDLEEFFFLDLLYKLQNLNRTWEGVFCMIQKNSFTKSCLYMSEVPGNEPGAF